MKLYDTTRAPNPRRVRWLMAEKGIEDLEIEQVDIFTGQHRTPEYRAKAGFPHVPALELDDGTTITESLAICRYLEARYPEPNLFGTTPEETAVIEMWTRRCEIYLSNPVMLFVRLTHPALSALETPKPEVAEYNKTNAERFMSSLNKQLATREFVAGDRFTIADIVAAVGVDFGRLVKYRPPEELTAFNAWLDRVKARPAASAGL